MERIICLVMGYVFGLFQTAYFYGRLKGIDIRKYGSGNAGATNAKRVFGSKIGLLVLLFDCLKCIIPVVIARCIFGASHPEMIYLLCLYAGTGAILGHNYPFFMNFKGGKGISATAGLVLSFHPYFVIVGVILFFGAFFITHYVSLGSLLVYAGFLIQMIICGQSGFFEGMTQPQLWELYGLSAFLAAMAYWKHRANIVRLLHGTENKTYLSSKNKEDKSLAEEDKSLTEEDKSLTKED